MRAGTRAALALPIVPVPVHWLVSAAVLLGSAAVLVWAHLAVAALSVCLNETPGLAIGMREALPASASTARSLLPALGLIGVDEIASAQTCDAAAPARAMAIAGVAYLVGIVVLERGAIPKTVQYVMIGAVAGSIQFALFFMPGLLSSDILDYASHGRVASVHAANPYLLAPAAFPGDPFASQGAWPQVVTVYGPLWTHVDAAITGLLAADSSVQLAFAYKALGLMSHLACLGLIWWIAGRWNARGITDASRAVAVALWAWNPLVNIEVVGSAHNEGTMTVFVLLAFALLTAALCQSAQRSRFLWLAAIVCLGLGALVKFVPASIGAIVSLVWLRRAPTPPAGLRRGLIVVVVLLVVSVVVAWPWLDSPAVAQPLLGLAAGGQRFKDAWQDTPAAWLAVRVVPVLGVPDEPATLRMDIARTMVWSLTRFVFVAYVGVEAWFLWKWANTLDDGLLLRRIASASVRSLLLAVLLFVSQVYAWYFLWPLPFACLLGLREPWSRAAVVFGLAFLPAFYLREFQPYGVFYLAVYCLVALALLAMVWFLGRVPRLVVQH